MTVTRLKPDFRISADAQTDLEAHLQARLAALEARIASIEARLTPQRRINAADRRTLALLLPAIAKFSTSNFTVNELIIFAHESADQQLLSALADRSPKQIGRLFARCMNVPVAGFTITSAGNSHGAKLWLVSGG